MMREEVGIAEARESLVERRTQGPAKACTMKLLILSWQQKYRADRAGSRGCTAVMRVIRGLADDGPIERDAGVSISVGMTATRETRLFRDLLLLSDLQQLLQMFG